MNRHLYVSDYELDLILEALLRAAARRDSLAAHRPRGRNVSEHETVASEMRRLRANLIKVARNETIPVR